MAKKPSLLKKLAKWISGSLQKFADEGFADNPHRKPRKKSAKRSAVKKLRAAKKVSGKKAKPIKKNVIVKAKKPLPVKAAKPLPKLKAVPAKPVKPVPVKAAPVPKAKALPGKLIGTISHYFEKANACAFKVQHAELKEGATIVIQGPNTKVKLKVKSIQINRIPVPSGKPGEDIGIGVPKPVESGDFVYLVEK